MYSNEGINKKLGLQIVSRQVQI